MKIYTKKGDEGKTSLIGGTRVPKYHIRIEAYGTVDELNSWMGILRDQGASAAHSELILRIQNNLFTIGSQLANDPEASRMALPDLEEGEIDRLEKSMDEMEEGLEPLKNFVLPGGHPDNSRVHVARCVCRRAERCVVQLNEELGSVNPLILKYLNRLSDWLFVYAREVSRAHGAEEIPWKATTS